MTEARRSMTGARRLRTAVDSGNVAERHLDGGRMLKVVRATDCREVPLAHSID